MESSTARWSIPGKSISFNEGAEEKTVKVLWGFHKAAQQNKKANEQRRFSTEIMCGVHQCYVS
jgi:hypothetical protein